jgi:hypothetical protein
MEPPGLNVFQRITRQWDELHPYNAAQAMQLVGAADIEKLKSAWHSTLNNFNFQSSDLLIATSLDELMTQQLNEKFDDTTPFRPFLIQESNSHFIGVIYHHWIADSFSIRMLIHEWFSRIYDRDLPRLRFRVAHEGYWELFRSTWNISVALLDLSRWIARFRHVMRVDPIDDLRVHFSLHHAPQGLIQAVADQARKSSVTVNDVFLAAMAQACAMVVPVKRTPRRWDLALGTIADLRPRSSKPLDNAFGLFLGFTSVLCRPDELRDWNKLLRHIHQQNTTQKATGAAEASMLRMAAGLMIGKFYSRPRLLEFYRKRLALAGGISNVNLNKDWPMQHHPSPILDYVRVSPCGPTMPVVFTPTTLGDKLNVGLTCRQAVIPQEKSAQLIAIFFDRLQRFTYEGRAASK